MRRRRGAAQGSADFLTLAFFPNTDRQPNMIATNHSSLIRLAPGVYLAPQDDIIRILDLDRGRFFGLDAVASRLLTLSLEVSAEQAAAQVASEYGVDPAVVQRDLEALLENLRHRKVVQRGTAGRAAGPRWLPRWLAGPCRVAGPLTARLAGRLLRRAWWSLRLDGWSSTLQRWSRPTGATSPVREEQAADVITIVDEAIREAAAGQWLFPMACKERALVGHHLLRVVFGLPASLVLGVRHYPFGMHAWVEVQGRTVTDAAEHCATFEPVELRLSSTPEYKENDHAHRI
jgi:hypothetical protein